jgi:hypothetical protein
MSRRSLTLAVLAIVSFVVTACASPTAPRHEDACTGWLGNSQKTCP